jgi:hypothetical protein
MTPIGSIRLQKICIIKIHLWYTWSNKKHYRKDWQRSTPNIKETFKINIMKNQSDFITKERAIEIINEMINKAVKDSVKQATESVTLAIKEQVYERYMTPYQAAMFLDMDQAEFDRHVKGLHILGTTDDNGNKIYERKELVAFKQNYYK